MSNVQNEEAYGLEDSPLVRGGMRQLQRAEWGEYLGSHLQVLHENKLPARNLHHLAMAYLGLRPDSAHLSSPQDRLADLIGDDPQLIASVIAALRDSIRRDDLPEVAHTIELSLQARHSLLTYPVLASLHLMYRENQAGVLDLDDEVKRRALAIYYCAPPKVGAQPWHNAMLDAAPQLVLDTLLRCALASVRAGKEVIPGLRELDHGGGPPDMVHAVRIRLLTTFPTRNSKRQIPVLDSLLSQALQYLGFLPQSPQAAAQDAELRSLARGKQTRTSMPIAQRVRWWATDALLAKGNRLGELVSDLTENEVRLRHFAQFLKAVWSHPNRGTSILADIGDPHTLEELTRVLGAWCKYPRPPDVIETLESSISTLVSDLIAQLGRHTTQASREALARLAHDADLQGWIPQLQNAQQAGVRSAE